MKTILKVLIGVVLAGVLLIGGCVALIGSAADDVQDDAQKHAITRQQFRAIDQGTSRSDVVRQLGKPEDAQEFESASFLDKEPVGSSCIYYNEKGAGLLEGTTYQLCFTNDRLDSKAAY